MKTKSIFYTLAAAASLIVLSHSINALADGTETLGPPSIAIESGSGIVAAGTGMIFQPGEIEITVPNGTVVKQVLLYWEGFSSSGGDNSIIVEGNAVTGTLIGGPTLFFDDNESFTYRADITDLDLVAPGSNSLTISGLNFDHANNGAGIMVIYDDGSPSHIDLRDGNDLAFIRLPSPLDTTVPQIFTFAPSTLARTATLSMFFSSVEGPVSGGTVRPSAIEITVAGNTTVFDNELSSVDGFEWDTVKFSVPIPAGATELKVQALSVDNLGLGYLPASFAWSAAGLSIAELKEGEGCTPGYWKQAHHFDSWTAPYTPSTQFDDVFENAFPGKTLLQVLKLRGGGLKALGRHTVAALLNAASSGVDYDLTVSEVIDQFNAVYPGTKANYTALKNTFADFNEQGCPLN